MANIQSDSGHGYAEGGRMRMLAASVLIASVGWAAAQSIEVQVVQDGLVAVPDEEALAAKLVALVESASVDSTEAIHPADHWEGAFAEPIFIHALFKPPRAMKVMNADDESADDTSPVREIFVPLPRSRWTDHIFLKTDKDIRSLSKYAPCAMAELVVASGLRMENDRYPELLQGYCLQYNLRDTAD